MEAPHAQAPSRKRSMPRRPEDELSECGTITKKIKNFHLRPAEAAAELAAKQGDSIAMLASPAGPSGHRAYPAQAHQQQQPHQQHAHQQQTHPDGQLQQPAAGLDCLEQRLLSEQIVNYGNQIINCNYAPQLDAHATREYVATNRLLFEANKMRLLRAQMRLLEQPK